MQTGQRFVIFKHSPKIEHSELVLFFWMSTKVLRYTISTVYARKQRKALACGQLPIKACFIWDIVIEGSCFCTSRAPLASSVSTVIVPSCIVATFESSSGSSSSGSRILKRLACDRIAGLERLMQWCYQSQASWYLLSAPSHTARPPLYRSINFHSLISSHKHAYQPRDKYIAEQTFLSSPSTMICTSNRSSVCFSSSS